MKKVKIEELNMNPYTLYARNWAALCSGSEESGFNAMTIAWGEIGSLWERTTHSNRLPVATVFVRQSRTTKALMDDNALFSINFMPEDQKKALGYLGSIHGRDDKDKIAHAGLTAVKENNTVYIAEAELVLICRKLYQQDMEEKDFVDQEILSFNYPNEDLHTIYTGEIIEVLEK